MIRLCFTLFLLFGIFFSFPVSSQSPDPLPEPSFFSKVISFEWIQSFFSHFFQQKTTLSSLLIGEDTSNTPPPSNLTDPSSPSPSSSPSPWIFVCPRYHAFFSKQSISTPFTACTSQKEYQGSTCACEDTSFTSTDVTSQASWSITLPDSSSSAFASVTSNGVVTGEAQKLPRGIGIGYAKVSASLNEKKDTSEVSVQMPNGGFSTIAVEGDEGGGGGDNPNPGGQCTKPSGTIGVDTYPLRLIYETPVNSVYPYGAISNSNGILVYQPVIGQQNFIPGCIDGRNETYSPQRCTVGCTEGSASPSDHTIYSAQVVAPNANYGDWQAQFQTDYDQCVYSNAYGAAGFYRMWVSYTPGGPAINTSDCEATEKKTNTLWIGSKSRNCFTSPIPGGQEVCTTACPIESGCMFYLNFQSTGDGNGGRAWAESITIR